MIERYRYSATFIHKIRLLFPLMAYLLGCTATNTITNEEVNNQNLIPVHT